MGTAQSIAQAVAQEASLDAAIAPGQSVEAPAVYLDEARALAAEPAQPAWLGERRRAAVDRVEALGFPTTRNEDWHYTSVSPIAEAAFPTLRAPSGEVTREQLAPYLFDADWPTLVFVNGRYRADLSSRERLPDGVRATSLAQAIAERPELVEKSLGAIATADDHPFVALNQALAVDGAVITVAKEMEADVPVHLLFVTDATAARTAIHPRILVQAERHARLLVVESWVGLGESPYLTNAVTEIDVADGATVHHLRVQRESPRAFHVAHVEAKQGRDSHYVSFSFAAGAQLSRTNVHTVLGGEGCGATLNGLYMLDGAQHCDHQTRIEHAQPNCYSRELYKGILDGASHGVFNGKVYVHPIAQKTDGKQTNNTLLLSEQAHIDTKPQLEIFADDVKCTHGATVGRLDETALFYMKSRGLASETARRLLTYAFAADVLETIEVPAVVKGLEEITLARYAGG